MIDYFLASLALIWIIYASISDLKKREVPNWLSFSLIAFSLAYRALFSAINANLWFFVSGLIYLGIFIALGYAFYYARVFAGGDAKLLMSIGAILPVSSSFMSSLGISAIFIFLMLFFGGIWGLFFSFILALKHKKEFKKELGKQIKLNKKIFYYSFALAVPALILVYFDMIFIFIVILVLLSPILYVYAKSVEEACMIKTISSSKLVEGDWLYQEVRIKGKTIKPNWEGLSEKQVSLLKKYNKKVKVKEGIPFVPSFFFAFISLICLLQFEFSIFNMFF